MDTKKNRNTTSNNFHRGEEFSELLDEYDIELENSHLEDSFLEDSDIFLDAEYLMDEDLINVLTYL